MESRVDEVKRLYSGTRSFHLRILHCLIFYCHARVTHNANGPVNFAFFYKDLCNVSVDDNITQIWLLHYISTSHDKRYLLYPIKYKTLPY